MGIKVKHDVESNALGDAAYITGLGQGNERRRQQDRSYELSREVNMIREKARQDANARFFAQLSQNQQTSDREFDFREMQYEEFPQRQRQFGEMENDLTMDLADRQYSRSQQSEIDKLAQARDYVQRNADGRYSPEEQKILLQQIDEATHGIQPTQNMYNKPWPKQQDSGQVWVDESTGTTLTRDDKGNVKVLVKPENINSFDSQLKVREKIVDYAASIFKSLEMSENPPSWVWEARCHDHAKSSQRTIFRAQG